MAGSRVSAGLVPACDDRRLFNFPLWPRQRELLAAVEAGPRLHVWALGRRSGKTTLAAVVALWDCLLRPDLDRLVRPGERRYAVGVATNLRQARLLLHAARSIVERSPLLAELVEAANEDEILFRNGTGFAAFPCSSRSGRGWPISCLVMDEAAHFLSETEGWTTAERVFEALVPATAQFGDAARIIISSTPFGEAGLFAQLFQQASSGELPDAIAHHATTPEVNPTLDAAFLEREQARDPDSFKAEYLAQFRGSGGAFLDPERIADALVERSDLPPEAGVSWVAGLDPAFSSDPFGLAIVGRPRDRAYRQQLVLGLVRSWKPSREKPASFEERRALEDAVLEEVASVCLHYGARVVTDQFAAPAIVDFLRRRGLAVETIPMTAATKTACFSALRARLNFGGLELYEAPGLVPELRRLRSKYRAGASLVENPRVGGSHGDMAQALALATYEIDRYGLGGTETRSRREPDESTRAITAGLVDIGRGFVRRDPTRKSRWFDRDTSIADRSF